MSLAVCRGTESNAHELRSHGATTRAEQHTTSENQNSWGQGRAGARTAPNSAHTTFSIPAHEGTVTVRQLRTHMHGSVKRHEKYRQSVDVRWKSELPANLKHWHIMTTTVVAGCSNDNSRRTTVVLHQPTDIGRGRSQGPVTSNISVCSNKDPIMWGPTWSLVRNQSQLLLWQRRRVDYCQSLAKHVVHTLSGRLPK